MKIKYLDDGKHRLVRKRGAWYSPATAGTLIYQLQVKTKSKYIGWKTISWIYASQFETKDPDIYGRSPYQQLLSCLFWDGYKNKSGKPLI